MKVEPKSVPPHPELPQLPDTDLEPRRHEAQSLNMLKVRLLSLHILIMEAGTY